MNFSVEVGRRLRGIRRARQLSLDDVERISGGRWSASAVGAYERGFRNLSLPRLRDLAQFYEVPMAVLIGEDTMEQRRPQPGRIVLDLEILAAVPEAVAVTRYLRTIVVDRGEPDQRTVAVRRDDIRALAAILHVGEAGLLERLRGWRALLAAEPDNDGNGTDAARSA